MSRLEYMTAEEFLHGVLEAASECGYGWITVGEHHPEDLAVNLGPIMAAYAAGMTEAIRRQAKADRAGWEDKA